MISYVNSDLFKKSSTKKEFIISYDDGEIRNNKIYSEQFELKERLCSADNILFGKCESSEVRLKISNEVDSLKDKEISVSIVLNGLTGSPFALGKYKVYSDVVSGNRNYRNIVAYDDMYYILNTDITSWYEGLEFPITVKQMRDSLFSYLGINQETTTLINDSVLLEKTVESVTLKGKDIIPYICEINGVFGHMGRNGNFKYISLSNTINETITSSDYSATSYDDFETGIITGLQIRQEEGDVGVTVGTEDNKYVIQGNILLYGMESETLTIIAQNIFNKIKNVQYVPFDVSKLGNPCMEVGDRVSVSVRDKDIESFILERTLYGIQTMKDDYAAKGKEKIEDNEISLDEEIKQLKGRSNVLKRDLDSTKSEITNLEEVTSTKIEQTAKDFNLSIQSLEDNMKASDEATNEEIGKIKKSLEVTATSEDIKIEIEKERETGAGKVVTSTGYTLNDDGLKIEKSDSEMATTIMEDGMRIMRSGEQVLVVNNEGVDAENLHATTYLIIGHTSRFEDFYDDNGALRTGCFWIGDIPYVESISATYTGGEVTVGTALSLLTGITVTAHYSDGSTANVTGYTLSGTIAEGSNTITVNYEGKTTTFTVTGVSDVTMISITATYTGGDVPVGTSLTSLTGLTVKANFSDGTSATLRTGTYTLSGTIADGSNTITVKHTESGLTTTFKVTGVAESSGETASNLTIKTGTITGSSVIETGLSSIKQLSIWRTTCTTTGIMNASYNKNLGTQYAYCSSWGSYIKGAGEGSSSYASVDGGTVTWAGSGSTGITGGDTYTWVAVGEE